MKSPKITVLVREMWETSSKNYLSNLLGNNNSEEEIDDFEPEIVIKHTEIFTNAFTKDEYLMVKNNLVDGKK